MNNKRLIAGAVAAITMVGAPTFANSLDNSSAASVKASNAVAKVSVSIVESTSTGLRTASEATMDASASTLAASKNLALKGIALGQNSTLAVIGALGKAADSTSNASTSASAKVVTVGGEIIDASLSASRRGIRIVIDSGKSVYAKGKELVIGTAALSVKASKATGEFVMDSSGRIIDASGKAIGFVYNESKELVSLAVDSSGKVLTLASNGTEILLKGSSESMKSLASWLKEAASTSKKAATISIKSSAQGAVIVVTAVAEGVSTSARGASQSGKVLLTFTSDSLKKLLNSEVAQQENK